MTAVAFHLVDVERSGIRKAGWLEAGTGTAFRGIVVL